jgi:hypothetical protein
MHPCRHSFTRHADTSTRRYAQGALIHESRDTFAGYRPHVTLAYISATEADRDAAIAALNTKLAGARFPIAPALDDGGNHG